MDGDELVKVASLLADGYTGEELLEAGWDEHLRVLANLRMHLHRLDQQDSDSPPRNTENTENLPRVPLDLLPGVIGEFTRACSAAFQVPHELPGLMSLSTLSAATRGRWQVEVQPGWEESLSLYAMPLALSGERKSAVRSAVCAPLQQIESELIRTARPRVHEHQDQVDLVDERIKHLRSTAVRAKKQEERAAAATELLDAQKERRQLDETRPRVPQLIGDDITPEALARVMADNDESLAIISAEGGFTDILGGRYSDSPNLDLVLKAHNGEPVTVNRRGGETVRMERPFLALALCVQPDVVGRMRADSTMTDRGLLARIVYALPPSALGRRQLDPEPIPTALRGRWHSTLAAVLHHDMKGSTPRTLTLTPAARTLLTDYRHAHEPRLHPDWGEYAPIKSWASKLPGALVRIAAMLALADSPGSVTVAEQHMASALTLADSLAAHALRVLTGPLQHQASPARQLLDWALTLPGSPAEFTAREAREALNGRRWVRDGGAAAVDAALAELEHLGRISVFSVSPPPSSRTRGRPESTRYRLLEEQLPDCHCWARWNASSSLPAASLLTRRPTCPYRSLVSDVLEWPSSSDTTRAGTPETSISDANECRRVCGEPSSPARPAILVNTLPGTLGSVGLPMVLVNTMPVSVQAVPAASRSRFCWARHLRSATTAAGVRGMGRLLRSLLGSPRTRSFPTLLRVYRTCSHGPPSSSRCTSSQCSPNASPVRIPVWASTTNSGSSRSPSAA